MIIGNDGWPVAEPGDPEIVIIKAHPSRTLPLDRGVPVGLVWHYDAVRADAPSMNRRLQGKAGEKGAAARNVSWHVNLLRTGTQIWCVSALRGGRHVGKPGKIRGKVQSANRNLIGVELANAGHLHRVNGRYYASWKRDGAGVEKRSLGPDPKSEIANVYGGKLGVPAQEAFTMAQRESAIVLCNALLKRFPDLSRADLAYTHEFFDHPRKGDPGQAWCVGHLPAVLEAVEDPTPTGAEALAEVKRLIGGLL